MQNYDVGIVGGGPAGAVAALELTRHNLKVVVFERSDFSNTRVGETLPPEANPILRGLGLWDAILESDPLESPGLVSYWGSPGPQETDFIRNPNGPGWHLDRKRFDAVLLQHAESKGAEIRRSTMIAGVHLVSERWVLRSADGDETSANFIVDASGRNGIRLAEFGAARIFDDHLIAVILRLTPADDERRTLIESTPDGWWYTAPVPGNALVSVLVTDPQFYKMEGVVLSEQLERAPATCARIGNRQIVESDVVHISSSVRNAIIGNRYACVGDSAVSYDPISGYGLTAALQSGRAFADSYVAGDLPSFERALRARFTTYRRQRLQHYASEKRWPKRRFWRARQMIGM